MKTYKATFQPRSWSSQGITMYIDTIVSPFKWVAKIGLKMRNSAKMIKIERI